MTAAELSRLLAACKEHRPTYFPFVLTLARTGMRLGEAIELRWGDVDFAGGFLRIERAFSGGRLTSTKSDKSRRRVDMSAGLAEVLHGELAKAKERALKNGLVEPDPRVFVGLEGGRIDGNNFRQGPWRKMLEKAGLRYIRIHEGTPSPAC